MSDTVFGLQTHTHTLPYAHTHTRHAAPIGPDLQSKTRRGTHQLIERDGRLRLPVFLVPCLESYSSPRFRAPYTFSRLPLLTLICNHICIRLGNGPKSSIFLDGHLHDPR